MIHFSRNFLALSTSLLIGVLQGTGLSAQPVVISDLVEGKAVVEFSRPTKPHSPPARRSRRS